MKKILLAAALGALSFNVLADDVDLSAYLRKDQFETIQMSPTGQYFAATVPLEDRTVLVVIERGTNKLTANFKLGRNTVIHDYAWVTPNRLVIGTTEKFGALDEPRLTGELFAMNADGTGSEILVGQRVDDGGPGTNIKGKKGNDKIAAFLLDAPPADTRTALISAQPYVYEGSSARVYTSVERIDLFTGRLQRVATVPVPSADFVLDNHGAVRFAYGSESDNLRKLYYRADDNAKWDLIATERNGRFDTPIGFSEDDKTAYLLSEQDNGPAAIVAYDTTTGKRTQVLRDNNVDPDRIIYRSGTRIPVGVYLVDGKPRTEFFDAASPEARLYKSLEAAFAGNAVFINSQTTDGRLVLVKVSSDRNPGDYYLFDTVAKKAELAVSTAEWIDPAQQAEMRPIQLTARDGLPLNGYITLPKGSNGKNLPMVVMPHGGPFGVMDSWGFDKDGQLLAAAGYAVLQVNFRGSAGYGMAFKQAGAREYGGKMQDDLTDATRWAIEQGIADKGRICLYGASYGGYASLMGVAKEPSLYKCAAGYVGVYDLPTKYTEGDVQRYAWGQTYLREWMGAKEKVADVSPTRLADRIKVPVFLAAGGQDERAPIVHSRLMEQALRKAGTPVETLYYDTEGHGFYTPEHRREFYTRLLAFLSRSLGGGVAATGAGAGDAKAAK